MKTKLTEFHYEILYNMIFLNEKRFPIRKCPSPIYSFCKCQNKNVTYLLSKCNKINSLWTEITNYFSESVQPTNLTPQIAFFGGYLDKSDKIHLIQNLVLVVLKFCIYKSRVSDRLYLNTFLHKVVKERII